MTNGLRILLLDDIADTRRLATEMLTADGYAAYACSTCDQAARMASLVRPSVVLVYGCDGDHQAVIETLLAAVPHIPLVRYSEAEDCYQIFSVRKKKTDAVCGEGQFHTVGSAIRAAVLQSLETA